MFVPFPVPGFAQICIPRGCINWRDFIAKLMVFNAILAKSLMKCIYTNEKSRQLIQPHRMQIWTNPGTGNGTNIISDRAIDHMLDKTELRVTFSIFPEFSFFLHDSLRNLENQPKKLEKMPHGVMS